VGLDWRWRSWRRVAERVHALATALAGALPPELAAAIEHAAGGPGAPRLGFQWSPTVDRVALDLAVQAAGATAVPLPEGPGGEALARALADRGCAALVSLGEPVLPGFPEIVLPGSGRDINAELPSHGALDSTATELSHLPANAGPVAVEGPATATPHSQSIVTQTDLAAATAALATALPPPPGPRRPAREIVVAARPLAEPGVRLLLAWALTTGAPVALEPDLDPEILATTAQWIRPTLFAGTTPERRALLSRLAPPRSRLGLTRPAPHRHRPLGRLRAVLPLDGPPTLEEQTRWADLGVALVQPPLFPDRS
jgi:hypothetical protein